MITREEILTSPEYWFDQAQNDIFRNVVEYMENEGINQSQLAERLGVSKGYVSQIMKGEFNYTLKKLIDLSIAVGKVPIIEYRRIDDIIEQDQKWVNLRFSATGSMSLSSQFDYSIGGQAA